MKIEEIRELKEMGFSNQEILLFVNSGEQKPEEQKPEEQKPEEQKPEEEPKQEEPKPAENAEVTELKKAVSGMQEEMKKFLPARKKRENYRPQPSSVSLKTLALF